MPNARNFTTPPGEPPDPPIAAAVRASLGRLTAGERKAAAALLADYPMTALETVAQLAKRAHVSGPTVLRLIAKLGFSGYPEFQQQVRGELAIRLQTPLGKISRQPRRGLAVPDFLQRYAEAASTNIEQSLQEVARTDFDAVSALLAEEARHVLLLGGRFTASLALHLFLHLRELRGGAQLISGQTGGWAEHLLDLDRRDALVVYDIRRYQDDVVRFAEAAAKRGVRVVLFTDQWLSPIAALARYVFAVRTTAPSVWDSTIALSTLAEALLARMQERTWPRVESRIRRLEDIRNRLAGGGSCPAEET